MLKFTYADRQRVIKVIKSKKEAVNTFNEFIDGFTLMTFEKYNPWDEQIQKSIDGMVEAYENNTKHKAFIIEEKDRYWVFFR